MQILDGQCSKMLAHVRVCRNLCELHREFDNTGGVNSPSIKQGDICVEAISWLFGNGHSCKLGLKLAIPRGNNLDIRGGLPAVQLDTERG